LSVNKSDPYRSSKMTVSETS